MAFKKFDDLEDDSDELQAPPPPPTAPNPMGDMDQLLAEHNAAIQHNQNLAKMGAVGDALTSAPSFGEFLSGHFAPQHGSVSADLAAQKVEDPIDRYKKVLEDYRAKVGAQKEGIDLKSTENSLQMDHPLSGAKRGLAKMAVVAAAKNGGMDPKSPEYQNLMDSLDQMNGAEVDNLIKDNPFLKSATENQRTAAILSGMDLRRQGLGMRQDDQTMHAADKFDNDSNLKTLQQQQQRIRAGKHTLDSVKILTPQLFNEVQLDIANAISGGRAAAVSTQSKTEMDSVASDWAKVLQKYENAPKDINAPEMRQYISDVLDRLDGAYQKNMGERAKQIAMGRNYSHNQAAQQTTQQKVDSYQPKQNSAPEMSAEDKDALSYAQQNPGDPDSARILIKLSKKYPKH